MTKNVSKKGQGQVQTLEIYFLETSSQPNCLSKLTDCQGDLCYSTSDPYCHGPAKKSLSLTYIHNWSLQPFSQDY